MIHIDLLKNHPHAIPALAAIWHKVLGEIWVRDVPMESIVARFENHLNDTKLPITLVALHGDIPVGMCSLRENDGIRPDLTPWFGSLVVDPQYQKQGIGKMLMDAMISKAQELGFQKLYLFTFDPDLLGYYKHLGWIAIDTDEVKSHPVTVMERDI